MTTLKVTHKDEDGRIVNDTCFVYSSLENPATEEAELLEILSMLGKNVEVLGIERDFKQLGGYI